ncbi:MAG: hypothetical protein ACREBU_13415, partial [Nitrososphaera sp.]
MNAQDSETSVPEKPTLTRRGRPEGDTPVFPRHSLMESLRLAESIEKNNAGKPYDRIDLARSVDMSPNSSSFRDLITSSGRYGLTEGGRAADKIALTELGSSIVAPTRDEDRGLGLRKALLNPALFNAVYSFFDRKTLPREELFKNTLRKQFNIRPEDV